MTQPERDELQELIKDTIEPFFTTAAADSATIHQELSKVDRRLAKLDDRVEGLYMQVGALEEWVGNVDEHLARVEDRLGRVEDKVDRGFRDINQRMDIVSSNLVKRVKRLETHAGLAEAA